MRILLYSHNTRGLGHTSRNAAICQGIYELRPDSAVLVITGATGQVSELLPPNTDCVKIPSFDAIEQNGELLIVPERLRIPKRDLKSIRSAIIESTVSAFRPDAVVVDFSPMGKAGELASALKRLRGVDRGVRIYLGIRDIIGLLPDNSQMFGAETIRFLNEHYDAVLHYADPHIAAYEKDPDAPLGWISSGQLGIPIVSTGYVVRQERPNNRAIEAIREELGARDCRLVLACAGSGKHAFSFLRTVLESKRHFEVADRCILTVITGPYAGSDELGQLKHIAGQAGDVRILRFVPNMLDYMTAADLVIGTAGYNTMAEILISGTPSIIVPRIQVDSQEQLLRAQAFSELGICEVIDWEAISPTKLSNRVSQALGTRRERTRPIHQIAVGGRQRVASFIISDTGNSASPTHSVTQHHNQAQHGIINHADMRHPGEQLQRHVASEARLVPPIVVFHAVDPHIDDELSVTPEFLTYFLQSASDLGLQLISVRTLLSAMLGIAYVDITKCIVLTFDDGYEGFHEYALPVLEESHAECTLFVPTDWIGRDNSWNPKARFGTNHLSWEELRQLAGYGVEVASHGCSHRSLARLTPTEAHQELAVSKSILEDKLGIGVSAFAYPYGDVFADHDFLVAQYYDIALSVSWGGIVWPKYRYSLNRNDPQRLLQILGLAQTPARFASVRRSTADSS